MLSLSLVVVVVIVVVAVAAMFVLTCGGPERLSRAGAVPSAWVVKEAARVLEVVRPELTACATLKPQTAARLQARQSGLNAVSLLCVAIASMYSDCPDPPAATVHADDTWIASLLGGPTARCIPLACLLCEDDTTMLVYSPTKDGAVGSGWNLVDLSKADGSESKGTLNKTGLCKKMCFSFTYIFSAAPALAPVWMKTKVNAAELPVDKCKSGVLVITLRGLSTTGDTDIDTIAVGHWVISGPKTAKPPRRSWTSWRSKRPAPRQLVHRQPLVVFHWQPHLDRRSSAVVGAAGQSVLHWLLPATGCWRCRHGHGRHRRLELLQLRRAPASGGRAAGVP